MNYEILKRPRRLRDHPILNSMMTEMRLSKRDLVMPVFVTESDEKPVSIPSMPEIYRWPVHLVSEKIEEWKTLGIRAFALFPHIDPSKKDAGGSEILNPNSIIYQAGRKIQEAVGDIALIADLALDPYTTHGHDGILSDDGRVDNDRTVEVLTEAAVLAAQAGYDLVAPSDMMDGRVKKIRERLEAESFIHTGIISYSAKFSSSYYGPFREAVGSKGDSPVDKSGYQLNPANFREAHRELAMDADEGADILMVKPAEPYLDVIRHAKDSFNLPIAAYQVSGEYSRIWAAHQQGWLDLEKCAMESLTSIKRAGADLIFTYFAERISKLI
jgi:porphobilinogen synthase